MDDVSLKSNHDNWIEIPLFYGYVDAKDSGRLIEVHLSLTRIGDWRHNPISGMNLAFRYIIPFFCHVNTTNLPVA